MKFSDSDLKLLNTSDALKHLLLSDEINFNETVALMKYRSQLEELQIELLNLHYKVIEKELRLLILIEGREYAGKGELIRKLTEHLNPRSVKTVALQAPSPNQKKSWYFKRYVSQLPEPGVIAFFDRSWYNRAIVEPVNDFCTPKEYKKFMHDVNAFEKMLSDDGIVLLKVYLSISKEEQERRIKKVKNNPLRDWELSKVDKHAVELWDSYTIYEKKMFDQTNTKDNPWTIIDNENGRKAHLDVISYILKRCANI
jgi:polyphosphate kinase 2